VELQISWQTVSNLDFLTAEFRVPSLMFIPVTARQLHTADRRCCQLAIDVTNLVICRSVHEEKMAQFFKNNFSEDRWRKAALKNAFSLLGKQKFERAAAFFLLGGAVKDAIEVYCS